MYDTGSVLQGELLVFLYHWFDPIWIVPAAVMLILAAFRRVRWSAAVIFLAVYLVIGRWLLPFYLRGQVQRALASQGLIKQVEVTPGIIPLTWVYHAETEQLYLEGTVTPFLGVEPQGQTTANTEELQRRIRSMPELNRVFGRMRFPHIEVVGGTSGYTAIITDVRYQTWNIAHIHYEVKLDNELRVLSIRKGGRRSAEASYASAWTRR